MSDEKKVLWTPKRKQEIVLRLLKGDSILPPNNWTAH